MRVLASRRLVHAGPLVPDPAMCGGGPPANRLQRWLPQLLVRTDAPVIATAAWSCPRLPSPGSLPA